MKLLKKGNVTQCKNWRGIILLSVPEKTMQDCAWWNERWSGYHLKERKKWIYIEKVTDDEWIIYSSGVTSSNKFRVDVILVDKFYRHWEDVW